MDQLSAHLDRGWDLLTRGDARGARSSARRALEIDGDSPEAHTLLGQAAAQEGDADEALEHYRQAMALDDGYIDPMLNAAEVLIHPLQSYDEAIALCDEVLDFAEGQDVIVDAMLLKFDAVLSKGDRAAARRLLDELPEGPYEGAVYPFLIGRAWFEAGDAERADALLQEAVEREPENADGHYYLGMARDARRDWRGATLAFLQARDLDLHAPAPPWSIPRDAFHKIVEKAMGALKPEFLQALEGALVLVSDAPGMEIVADGVDPRAPVLVEGLDDYAGRPPGAVVRVFVYQRNIEHICGGIGDMEEEIAWQVSDEVGAILHPHEHPGSVPPPALDPAPGSARGSAPGSVPDPVQGMVRRAGAARKTPPAPVSTANAVAKAVTAAPAKKKKPRKKP